MISRNFCNKILATRFRYFYTVATCVHTLTQKRQLIIFIAACIQFLQILFYIYSEYFWESPTSFYIFTNVRRTPHRISNHFYVSKSLPKKFWTREVHTWELAGLYGILVGKTFWDQKFEDYLRAAKAFGISCRYVFF